MRDFFYYLLLFLLLVQGFILIFDEIYFHQKRGLKNFERKGHVVDSFFFFICTLVPLAFFPSFFALIVFTFLSFLSSLIITKDEWIHLSSCSGGEQWCHAILFICHGPILISLGMLWFLDPLNSFFYLFPALVFCWGSYQFFYWHIYLKESKNEKN